MSNESPKRRGRQKKGDKKPSKAKAKAVKETGIERADRAVAEEAKRREKARQEVIDRLRGAKDNTAMQIKRDVFLTCISRGLSIAGACEVACMTRQTHYNWLESDAEYKKQFKDAVDTGTESLEDLAVARASVSDLMLMFVLKARKPHVYRDNYKVEVEHNHTHKISFHDAFEQFRSRLDSAQKLLEAERIKTLDQDGTQSLPPPGAIDVTPSSHDTGE